jgi:hypothetical protein
MEGTQIRRQRVEWGEDDGAWVSSVQELDWLLDDLARTAADKPFVVELISHEGDSMSVGLGSEESVLSWVSADGNPPYYASRGNREAEGTVAFFYGGSWSEFPKWSAVPMAEARAVMRQFFQTGERPASIDWEEV